MSKKEKHIDFYTTGRQLTEEGFAKISERIKKDKAKMLAYQKKVKKNRKQKLDFLAKQAQELNLGY